MRAAYRDAADGAAAAGSAAATGPAARNSRRRTIAATAKARPEDGAERGRGVRGEPGGQRPRRRGADHRRGGEQPLGQRHQLDQRPRPPPRPRAPARRRRRLASGAARRGPRRRSSRATRHDLPGQGLDQARPPVAAQQLVHEAQQHAAGRGQRQPVQQRVVLGQRHGHDGQDGAAAEGGDRAAGGRQVQQRPASPRPAGRRRPAPRRRAATDPAYAATASSAAQASARQRRPPPARDGGPGHGGAARPPRSGSVICSATGKGWQNFDDLAVREHAGRRRDQPVDEQRADARAPRRARACGGPAAAPGRRAGRRGRTPRRGPAASRAPAQ